jgi:hypothetical protein
MSQHNIFVTPNYFNCLLADYVRSCIDKLDKDYQVGQTITIHESDPHTKIPSGRTRIVVIRSVGVHIKGLVKGYCVISFTTFR